MWEGIGERLAGSAVVLEPLSPSHREGLWEAAAVDPAVWDWMHLRAGDDRSTFDRWFERALERGAAGADVPFTTLDGRSGRPLGSTSYLNLRPDDRVLEIGGTWLTNSAWGTGANIEAKLLMLRRAFDELGCLRVEFKTDALNARSRAALAALPARFEGIHRKHMLVRGGERRDSAWYSVIDDEWPAVRANLERRLAGRGPTRTGPGV
jgi:RimJ/RimL family protein N-acetyltransferase